MFSVNRESFRRQDVHEERLYFDCICQKNKVVTQSWERQPVDPPIMRRGQLKWSWVERLWYIGHRPRCSVKVYHAAHDF